jgi:hypothetical protein
MQHVFHHDANGQRKAVIEASLGSNLKEASSSRCSRSRKKRQSRSR